MTTPKKQTKATLLDEIEVLNQKRREKLVTDLLNYLDPRKEEDVRIAAQLLNISEKEAKRRFYLSPEKLERMAQAAQRLTKEEIKQEVDRLRLDSERHRKIAETMIEIREQGKALQEMGLGLATTKELLKAVRKYNSIDEAVVAFREQTDESGYFGIEPEMIPVIKIYGTPHDKAILVIAGYFIAEGMGWEPKLTEKEIYKIRDNITSSSEKVLEEYREVFIYYHTLRAAQWMIRYQESRVYQTQRATEEAILKYEGMKQTQDFFNSVSSLIPTERQQELTALMEQHNHNTALSFNVGKLTLSPDGSYTDEGLQKQWEEVEYRAVISNDELGIFKTMEQGFIKWAEERRVKAIIYPTIKDLFNVVNDFGSLPIEISDVYYKYPLQQKRANGGTPTAEEEKLALLSDCQNVEPNDLGEQAITLLLNDEYERRNK